MSLTKLNTERLCKKLEQSAKGLELLDKDWYKHFSEASQVAVILNKRGYTSFIKATIEIYTGMRFNLRRNNERH